MIELRQEMELTKYEILKKIDKVMNKSNTDKSLKKPMVYPTKSHPLSPRKSNW